MTFSATQVFTFLTEFLFQAGFILTLKGRYLSARQQSCAQMQLNNQDHKLNNLSSTTNQVPPTYQPKPHTTNLSTTTTNP